MQQQQTGSPRVGVSRFVNCCGVSLLVEVGLHQLAHQLVAVDARDKRAGVVVICDVGRVLGEYITHYLVYRVVALDHEGVIHRRKNFLHRGLAVQRLELACFICHDVPSNSHLFLALLYQIQAASKVEKGRKLIKFSLKLPFARKNAVLSVSPRRTSRAGRKAHCARSRRHGRR